MNHRSIALNGQLLPHAYCVCDSPTIRVAHPREHDAVIANKLISDDEQNRTAQETATSYNAAMNDFIHRENLVILKRHLSLAEDGDRRDMIVKLLAEQEAKLEAIAEPR